MIAASPKLIRDACTPIKPVVTDLLDNLFENECGDTVSLLSLYYEHLSKEHAGSWGAASRFPWCHRNFSNIRVTNYVFSHCWFLIYKIIRGGGADGSIIIFNETELLDPGNVGIDDVLAEISPFFFKHESVISPGDLCVFSGLFSCLVRVFG